MPPLPPAVPARGRRGRADAPCCARAERRRRASQPHAAVRIADCRLASFRRPRARPPCSADAAAFGAHLPATPTARALAAAVAALRAAPRDRAPFARAAWPPVLPAAGLRARRHEPTAACAAPRYPGDTTLTRRARPVAARDRAAPRRLYIAPLRRSSALLPCVSPPGRPPGPALAAALRPGPLRRGRLPRAAQAARGLGTCARNRVDRARPRAHASARASDGGRAP
ncbi:uncharacterized protein V1518DRAFT_406451 [Limtongia smithiae]|uniref:uncharacterized protein n=1 Tax=Limtongia smithiae TaxID=1125753 RepID=UPI0034CE170E